MTFQLYHHNNNFYLIVDRGASFVYVIDLRNYSSRLIGIDELALYQELEFSIINVKYVISSLYKNSICNFDDFDKYQYSKIIYIGDNSYYVNCWRDIFNILRP